MAAGSSPIRQRVEISVGFPVPVDELLPLADHTQITVVEIDDLDRQAVLLGGGQLLNAHDDAALAGDAGDLRIRIGELHAHGGRQPEAHGSETAGVDPSIGLVEGIKLRCPHLMLAHVGGHVGVAAGDLVELLHHVLGLDALVRPFVVQAIDGSTPAARSPWFRDRRS